MPGNARARAADPGAAAIAWEEQIVAEDSPRRSARQEQPVERHWPIPTDKVIWFELAPVHRLVGTWQGPGTIERLRRAR
jgi:hypothetical protein